MIKYLINEISFVSIIVIINCLPSFSQISYIDYGSSTEPELLDKIVKESFKIYDSIGSNTDFLHYSIIEVRDKRFLLPDGRFDVFEWKDNRWKSKYRFNNNGYNFNSYKFAFKNEIYSYGGYGFWRGHGDLIKFDEEKEGWELIKYDDDIREGLGNAFYANGNLYVINPMKYIDLYPRSWRKSHNFRIDLTSFKKYKFDLNVNDKIVKCYETQNFVIFFSDIFYLLDKRSEILYYNDLDQFIGFNELLKKNKLFFFITNDIINIIDSNRNVMFKYVIEDEIKRFKPVNKVKKNSYFLLLFIGIVVVAVASLVFYVRRNGINDEKKSSFKSHLKKQINDLLALESKILTSDELDIILGINIIASPETLRYKRAELINSINSEMLFKSGKKLIYRVKDPEDRRKFLYEVNGV